MPDAPSKRSWKDLADFDISQPEDVLALIERFQGEWGNGGFSQLFANWNRADIVLLPEALRIAGVPQAAPTVEAAIAVFPADQDDWRQLGRNAMADLADPVGQVLWNLDGALRNHETVLARAVEAFELKLSEDDVV